MKYTDFMIDLETLSNTPTACIVQIGAIPFNRDTGECGTPFSVNVLPNMKHFDVNADTIRWWMHQSEDARQRVFPPGGEGSSIGMALSLLREDYAIVFGEEAPKGVWALPASFDLPILDNAFSACGLKAPWPYHKPRCCRTLFDIAGIGKEDRIKPEDLGLVAHNAASDCIAQAKTVALAFDCLNDDPLGGWYISEKREQYL